MTRVEVTLSKWGEGREGEGKGLVFLGMGLTEEQKGWVE